MKQSSRCYLALPFLFLGGLASSGTAQTLTPRFTMTAAQSGVVSVQFSRSGGELFTGDGSGNLQVWNPREGKLIKSFATKLVNFRSAALSPTGSTFVSAGCDSQQYNKDQTQIWARNTGTWLRTLSATIPANYSSCTNSVAFSPNGQVLASGMGIQKGADEGDPSYGQIVLWSANSGKAFKVFKDASDVLKIAFSPNGKMLASAGVRILEYRPDDSYKLEGRVIVWNPTTGKRAQIFTRQNMHPNSIDFSKDGKTILLGCSRLGADPENSAGEVKLWNIVTGKVTQFVALPTEVEQAIFSPDGRYIVTISSRRTFGESTGSEIIVWDAKKGKTLSVNTVNEDVKSIAFSPDGKLLVSGGSPQLKLQTGGRLESFALEQFRGIIKVWEFSE